jgi:hypothetical protein
MMMIFRSEKGGVFTPAVGVSTPIFGVFTPLSGVFTPELGVLSPTLAREFGVFTPPKERG